MLVFLDESGDSGMKLERGSSPYFVVALVLFADHAEAQACDDAIAQLRIDKGYHPAFEFHFAKNSQRVREAFLDRVSAFKFESHVFALNKARVPGPGFQRKDSLYKWTAKIAFENAQEFLTDARIVLDQCGDRAFQRELSTYLKRNMNPRSGRPIVNSVKAKRSDGNNLLQLADYVASASARHISGGAGPAAMLRNSHLRKHERTFRVWPP